MEFNVLEVPRETIIEMLTLEQKLRYSKEIQDRYTLLYNLGVKNSTIIERAIQSHVMEEFGFASTLPNYWKIAGHYAKDQEVLDSSFYMKWNIFTWDKPTPGSNVRDCQLIDYATRTPLRLNSVVDTPGKATVLFVGSMT